MKKYHTVLINVLILVLLHLSSSFIFPCDVYNRMPFKQDDHSKKDASFFDFKNKLEKAVESKDVKFIESITDKEISFAFEEGAIGKNKFLKYWKLEKNHKSSLFWDEFGRMLKLGFAVDSEGLWTVPYLFNQYPESIDPYSDSLIIGSKVNIRNQPNKNSDVLSQISWEFVKNVYDDNTLEKKQEGEPCIWKKVCLPSGKIGYVCDQYLRSPFDYRAGFKKNKNAWTMIFFTTGSD